MAKDASVAPKERINIVYKPATGDGQEEVELPLKLLMMGDYTMKEDDTPVEDRKVVSVDKNNFDDVMRAHNLNLSFTANNTLTDEKGEEIPVNLKFDSLKDFAPEGVATQVPELKKLMELRDALTTLKGPLGNVPAFRKRLQAMISDSKVREQLLKELEVKEGGTADTPKDPEQPSE